MLQNTDSAHFMAWLQLQSPLARYKAIFPCSLPTWLIHISQSKENYLFLTELWTFFVLLPVLLSQPFCPDNF